MRKNKFILEPSFYIGISILLLLIPPNWVFAWFVAMFFHEACHYLALFLLKYKVISLRLSVSGIFMRTENMTHAHELIVALAGPAGSLFLLPFAKYIPSIALCAMLQSIYNLFPVFPYDGGRVLKCLLQSLLSRERGERAFRIAEDGFLLIFASISIYLSLKYHLGVFPLLILISMLLRCGKLKIPCKQRKQGVQYSTLIT